MEESKTPNFIKVDMGHYEGLINKLKVQRNHINNKISKWEEKLENLKL